MGKNKKEKKQKIVRQTTKEEREKFANEMKLMLTMNNYGFASAPDHVRRPPGGLGGGIVTYDTVNNLRAVKELKVRLAVFVATGKTDVGIIEFPECNRDIVYSLNGENIGKCSIRLKALSDEQPYIFN